MTVGQPTSHYFISQRLRLHYVDWGNPTAPPLLLLHGGRDHCRNWDWVAQRLRDRWHVVAPDLRGHGDGAWSPDGDYSMLGVPERWHGWIKTGRADSGRLPRRYASFADALERMRSENRYLSPGQAEHLTQHAASRNEDGTWSWKFDNYVRDMIPVDMSTDQIQHLWNAITCPVLLCYGENSLGIEPAEGWASLSTCALPCSVAVG